AAGGPAGQGKTFIGSVTVQTDGAGHAAFNAATAPIFAGQVVTATATATGETDLSGDTSRFSNAFAAPLPLARLLVTPATQHATAGKAGSFTLTDLAGKRTGMTNYQITLAFATAG